jgi:Tfp pilus assembly protein PilO
MTERQPEFVATPKGPPSEAPAPEAAEGENPAVARLKAQATGDLRRQRELGVAAIAAIGAFLLLVYFPSVATLSQMNERINTDARQLRTDRERSRVLPEMRLTAQRLERDLSGFKAFPDHAPLNELIAETTQLGTQLQLRDLRCEPGPETMEGTLGLLPIRLTFEGNFENVYSFIQRCEQMPRPVRVQELHIRQKQAQQGNTAAPAGDVSVELRLNAYFQAGIAPRP